MATFPSCVDPTQPTLKYRGGSILEREFLLPAPKPYGRPERVFNGSPTSCFGWGRHIVAKMSHGASRLGARGSSWATIAQTNIRTVVQDLDRSAARLAPYFRQMVAAREVASPCRRLDHRAIRIVGAPGLMGQPSILGPRSRRAMYMPASYVPHPWSRYRPQFRSSCRANHGRAEIRRS
jgi:hypothetical protein